jgi:hypothetical protein
MVGSQDLTLNPDKNGVIVFDVPSYYGYKLKLSGGFWSSADALVAISPDSAS